MDVTFEIHDAEEGGFNARALGHSIFTQASTWEELRANILEATSLHFEDEEERPSSVNLRYTRHELIPLRAA